MTVEYFHQSGVVVRRFFSIRNFKNGTEHTVIGGNIQRSDGVKNKHSSNDGKEEVERERPWTV